MILSEIGNMNWTVNALLIFVVIVRNIIKLKLLIIIIIMVMKK